MLAAEIDRTVDLAAMYDACGDNVKLRVKLSAELRLLRQSTARMIASIKTELRIVRHPRPRKHGAQRMHGGTAGAVTMPQCRQGSRDAGLLIPGAYRAMLDYERAKYERRGEVLEIDGRELRVSWANEDDHAQGFSVWPRDLPDRLEAGEPIIMSCARFALALWQRDRERDPSAPRPRFALDRGARHVRVSRDDRVIPVVREAL